MSAPAQPTQAVQAAPVGTRPLIRPSPSLYVGSLNPDVTEANLFEIFNPVGPVASIRVCRDNITRRSLGYAYVNFHTMVDAERALDTLNYTQIKGKACRIMWSQRDPALRKSGEGNIFIKNLEKSIDNKSLHDTFSNFGNILSCRVMTDDNGNSLGYGFVHFETLEAAQQAIKSVNGMLLNDKEVFVGLHVPRKERSSKYEEQKKTFTNVFVKNLAESVDTAQLNQLFAKYGKITSAVVSAENGKSKGFGFVNFATHEEAARACDELNEAEIDGKKIYVGRAQKKNERKVELKNKYELIKREKQTKYQGVNLYVKNLEDSIDSDTLRNEFAAYGTITSAKVQTDEKGNSRGFGFVCYSSPEEATKAVTEMNGKMVGSKPIYVALAQRKDVRRQQLEVYHSQRNQMRMQSGVLPGYAPPIFYNYPPGVPPGGQQPYVYPTPMMRPRWPQGQPQDLSGYPQLQTGAPRSGARAQTSIAGARAPRPAGNGAPNTRYNGAMAGGQAAAVQGRNAGGAQGKYKLNANARNVDSQPPQPVQTLYPAQEPLTAAMLAAAGPEDQKQMLGERLYPLIQQRQPSAAGKITGMLLDMDNAELLRLLENHTDLIAKIDEAMSVLQAHEQQLGAQ